MSPNLRLITIALLSVILLGCNGPSSAPTPTSVPPTDVPTVVPPTTTSTATPVPPTSTSTATPLPTNTPTKVPTKTFTPEPTDTATPKPTNTKAATKAPTKPAATKVPTVPAGDPNITSVMVMNTFPITCRIVFWGPADLTLDANGNGTSGIRLVQPGTYGWRAFLGGAETGEAGNLEIKAGNTCLFVCDKEHMAVRYGCK